MKMKTEDKLAFRMFYQTLVSASGGITQAQIDFYFKVLKGNAKSRKAWAAVYVADMEKVPPIVKALLMSDTKLEKTDIAFIAASYIASLGFLDKILNSLFGWLK